MFIPQNQAIADNDLGNATAFVDFWSKFSNDDRGNYVERLRIGQHLTEEDCCWLLKWKDPRFLAPYIRSGPNEGRVNARVQRVLNILPEINKFRRGELTEGQFHDQTGKVFPNGLVWQVFLFHIAQPHVYPIADRNVFRAFRVHRHEEGNEDWEFYGRYRAYFGEIAKACGIPLQLDKVDELKRIDSALMSFGRFLEAYYRA